MQMQKKILDIYFQIRSKAHKKMDILEGDQVICEGHEKVHEIDMARARGMADAYLECCTMIERYLGLQDK